MTTDIAQHFERLIYDHESLIIPGFGGLLTSYRAATIDHVQGLLYPPSRTVRFDKNLHVNDGILINHLREIVGITKKEAEESITKFVDFANERLEKREILVLPGVGRLYKDYEGRLQFLQASTNFNQDAYGLSSVQFYPILRSKDTAAREAPLPDSLQPGPVTQRKRKSLLSGRSAQSLLPLVAGFALIAFAVSFLFLRSDAPVSLNRSMIMPVSEKRLNKKPTYEEVTTMSLIDSRKSEQTTSSITPDEVDETELEETPVIDPEIIELGPSRKKGIIIIGSYKFQRSIQKMADKVVEQGFDVYQQRIGNNGIIRVGAQFAYEDQADLKRKLKIIKENIEDRAWILAQ